MGSQPKVPLTLKCPLDGLVERCGAMSYQVGLGAAFGADDMASVESRVFRGEI